MHLYWDPQISYLSLLRMTEMLKVGGEIRITEPYYKAIEFMIKEYPVFNRRLEIIGDSNDRFMRIVKVAD